MATIATSVKELHTGIEDAIIVERANGDSACFAIQHYNEAAQLALVVLDEEENPRGDLMEISLSEAKHLRALFNDPRVVALLDQQ